jgi:hypothetical protein
LNLPVCNEEFPQQQLVEVVVHTHGHTHWCTSAIGEMYALSGCVCVSQGV